MIAVEVKGRDPKITWEIIGIYRAEDDDKRVLEKLAHRTGYVGSKIYTYIMRIGMATRKNLGEPSILK